MMSAAVFSGIIIPVPTKRPNSSNILLIIAYIQMTLDKARSKVKLFHIVVLSQIIGSVHPEMAIFTDFGVGLKS